MHLQVNRRDLQYIEKRNEVRRIGEGYLFRILSGAFFVYLIVCIFFRTVRQKKLFFLLMFVYDDIRLQ